MSAKELMNLGMQAELAKAVSGFPEDGTAVTATGTGIGDAAAITQRCTQVTGVASAGVQLPDEIGMFFVGVSANATVVYPHSASGTINGGSAGAGLTITAGDGGLFVRQSNLNWVGVGETG